MASHEGELPRKEDEGEGLYEPEEGAGVHQHHEVQVEDGGIGGGVAGQEDDGHDRLHTLAQHVVDAVEQQNHYPTDQQAADYQGQYRQDEADQEGHDDGDHHDDDGGGHDGGHDRNAAAEDLLSFATEHQVPGGVDQSYQEQFSTLLDHATASYRAAEEGGSGQSALQDAIDAETAAREALSGGFNETDVAQALAAGRDGAAAMLDENGHVVFHHEADQAEYDAALAQATAAGAGGGGVGGGGGGADGSVGGDGSQHHDGGGDDSMMDESDRINKGGRKRKRREPLSAAQNKLKKETHKEVERRRRAVISEGIEQISALLPNGEKQKGQILQNAAAFFKQTIEERDLLSQQLAELQAQKEAVDMAYDDLEHRYQADQEHSQQIEAAWAKDREELEQLKAQQAQRAVEE